MTALNIIFVTVTIILDVFYDRAGGLPLKTAASLSFVVLGIINFIYCFRKNPEKVKFAVVLLSGIIFAMLGDITLGISFFLGAATFAVGHILYLISFCMLLKPKAADLIPGGIIFIIALLIIKLVPAFDFGGAIMEAVCIVYSLILSLMTGKGIANLIREKTPLNIGLALGSFLFLFSDAMLIFYMFTDISPIFDQLCLYTYYPAQCVLSVSVYLAARQK